MNNLLRLTFDGRLISRNDDVNWPSRSCDLTPLDYLLWGVFKENCYADKLDAYEHLKANLCNAIAEVRLHTLEKVKKMKKNNLPFP